MGTNTYYIPTHVGTYSQQHDFEMDLPGSPEHKHVKPSLMADFRPDQIGPNR